MTKKHRKHTDDYVTEEKKRERAEGNIGASLPMGQPGSKKGQPNPAQAQPNPAQETKARVSPMGPVGRPI